MLIYHSPMPGITLSAKSLTNTLWKTALAPARTPDNFTVSSMSDITRIGEWVIGILVKDARGAGFDREGF